MQVAFKDYNIFKGMWQSPWAGFKYFNEVFSNTKFWLSLKNTVLLNLWDLIFGFPVPIILAIMLYEMRSLVWKRISQTILYLPHFLSWIIIGGLVTQMFSSSGMVNSLLKRLGGTPVNFLMDEHNWVVMYVAVGIWQSAGWGTIIYLAAISGVNTELYEAAEVDGCGRMKRIWHVTIPCIMPTIIIMLILQLGRMVGIGFERPYVMANDMVRNVSRGNGNLRLHHGYQKRPLFILDGRRYLRFRGQYDVPGCRQFDHPAFGRRRAVVMNKAVKTVKKPSVAKGRRYLGSEIVFNLIILICVLLCIIPVLHVVALSISGRNAVMSNRVFLLPKDLDMKAYQSVFLDAGMIRSLGFSVVLTVGYTAFAMVCSILLAYPLSKPDLPGQKWMMVFHPHPDVSSAAARSPTTCSGQTRWV